MNPRIVWSALAVTVALGITACGPDETPGAAAPAAGKAPSAIAAPGQNQPAAAPSGAPAAPAQPASAAPAAPAGSGSGSGGSGAGSGGSGGVGGGSAKCQANQLKLTWADGDGAPSGTMASLLVTNSSGSACSLTGYFGVDVISTTGERWNLPRHDAKVTTVPLTPGMSTDFTLQFLPADASDANPLTVDHLEVTPPDTTTQLTVNWPLGKLRDQSAATHPVTWINPVGV